MRQAAEAVAGLPVAQQQLQLRLGLQQRGGGRAGGQAGVGGRGRLLEVGPETPTQTPEPLCSSRGWGLRKTSQY